MKKILDALTQVVGQAFVDSGYEASYGKVTISNRPDLCIFKACYFFTGADAAADDGFEVFFVIYYGFWFLFKHERLLPFRPLYSFSPSLVSSISSCSSPTPSSNRTLSTACGQLTETQARLFFAFAS